MREHKNVTKGNVDVSFFSDISSPNPHPQRRPRLMDKPQRLTADHNITPGAIGYGSIDVVLNYLEACSWS